MEDTKIIFCLCIFIVTCTAEDKISGNETIKDNGNITIVSATGLFELGFFSPGKSKNRYLGIWYKSISTGTVVWVANRETPLTDKSGVLRLDEHGSLVLTSRIGAIVWSSNSLKAARKPVAQLLDTGSLVIGYEDDTEPKTYIWQSSDHLGDTLLPGMKLGFDLTNGLNRYLTSWKSSDDPSAGNYSMRINLDGFPQPLVLNASTAQFRFGPWDGIKFSGTSFSVPFLSFISIFFFQQTEIYYQFQVSSTSVYMRGVINVDGNINVLLWVNQTQSWQSLETTHNDDCDQYAFCGAYGVCNIAKARTASGVCECVKGYEPKFPERWKVHDWSGGCVRKTQFSCGHGDGFIPYFDQKLPDTRRSWFAWN